MIVIGGRSILAGHMTLGDFINYILFTGLMAAPVVQIASIGTQISEAFAGLDRIHDLMTMRTEDDEDSSRAPLEQIDGEIVFEDVTFEYNPGVPVLKHVSFKRARRNHDRAGWVQRFGQEHADQPGHGVQSPTERPDSRRWARPVDGAPA